MSLDPETEAAVMKDANILYERLGGDARQLSIAAAQFKRFAQGSQPGEVSLSGGVSATTGEPFVHLAFGGDYSLQMSPDAAREHALKLLEAAELAVSDAALYGWVRDTLEETEARAATVVGLVRDWRRDHWGGKA